MFNHSVGVEKDMKRLTTLITRATAALAITVHVSADKSYLEPVIEPDRAAGGGRSSRLSNTIDILRHGAAVNHPGLSRQPRG